jgi:hypothetical protein
MRVLITTALALSMGLMVMGQSQRLVLAEGFSNASCGPCAGQNPNYNTLTATNSYPNNPAKMVAIKYQTNWPGTDPMNAQNPTDIATRVSYYGVTGVPWGALDGTAYSGSNYLGALANLSQNAINTRYAVTSPFDLTVTHTVHPNLDSVTISVAINCTDTLLLGSGVVKLHVALTEKTITFATAPGSNGETSFKGVVRKMYPDGNGTTLSSNWLPGQQDGYSWTVPMPSYIYKIPEVGVVAFIQNNASKEVYQAGYSAPIPVPNYATVSTVTTNNPSINCSGDLNNASATISNIGSNPITSATVNYQVDNGSPSTLPFTGNIAPNGTANVSIPAITGVSGGAHSLNVWLTNINNSGSNAAIGQASATFQMSGAPSLMANTIDFEGSVFPSSYIIENTPGANGWSWVSINNGASKFMRCFFWIMPSGTVANLYTARYDLSGFTNPELKFDEAYTYYTVATPENDRLVVSYSTNCGSSWVDFYDKAGTALQTATPISNPQQQFVPAASDWRTELAMLNGAGGLSDVLIRFRGISDFGDNLFIDNIFIQEKSMGVDEVIPVSQNSMVTYPNPANQQATLRFNLNADFNGRVEVVNALGSMVFATNDQNFGKGDQQLSLPTAQWADGLYLVRLVSGNMEMSTRLVVRH